MRQLSDWCNLALTALVVLGLSLSATDAAAQKNHMNVRGTGAGVFTPPVNVTPLTGDLEGILYGYDASVVKVGDDGTIFVVVTHFWDITGKGTFYTRGEGRAISYPDSWCLPV